MFTRSFFIITGQVLLAIALVSSTYLVTQTYRQIKLGPGSVHVKGCAEKLIHSDFVKWEGHISVTADTNILGYEKMEKDIEILKQFLKDEGVPLSLVEFSPVNSTPIYAFNSHGHATNTIEKYVLNQQFSLCSSDILLITKVSQNVTTLLKDNVFVYSSSPQYFYLKINELKIQMLGEAAEDAKIRAETLLTPSDAKLGRLLSAQQGVFQITPAYSSSVSDYGENDTSNISKQIKAVVTVEYAIH